MLSERRLFYPKRWEAEYKLRGFVREWLRKYPSLFGVMMNNPAHPKCLSARLGTLDLFAQYSLQYLLRESEGVKSITWYKIANMSPSAADRTRTDRYWATMQQIMSQRKFSALQETIVAAGFDAEEGEPDLFCWKKPGEWFFAEAKRSDAIGSTQRRWFRVCRQALGSKVDLRVYRVVKAE